MADNVVKTKGALKSSKPGAGGGVTYDHPVIGVVKDNIDPTRSGKIRVQIEGATNKDSDQGGQWVTVQYLSTYFGFVKPTAGQDGTGDYTSNPSAYGQWQSPPDIGTKVLCIFAEGDPSRGYYIGAVVEPEALQMIPAIGSSDNVVPNEGEATGLAGATRLPVTSINTNNKNVADSTNYFDAPKPVHSYTASIMSQQGIIRDPIRGPISSSASREPVSRVGWGVATPGRPIMEGGYDDANLPENLDEKNATQLQVTARRGGHSIVMDDGDIIGRDQLIRIRTALGHQILMSDDGQTLMILHSNGQSYIELGKEGTVDIFSTNSFNVRTQGDINFHADQNINLHASEDMNIQAKNLHINTEEEFKMRAGSNLQLYSVEDFTVKSLGAAAIKADGQASLASSGTTFINGSKVNLNTGKSSVNPKKVPIITLISQPDTLHDDQKGFIAAPGKLLTVTTRTPAHYPWTAAGQGVDVKSTLDASKALPVTPSSAIQKANQEGLATGATAPAIATVASAPDVKPVSKALDKTVTNAVVGSVATSAATGEVKKAVTTGAVITTAATSTAAASATSTVTTTANGTTTTTTSSASASTSSSTKVVAVGAFAQSPTQMVNAGILKPGADTLVNGLAQKIDATIEGIMPKQIFAGKPGAKTLVGFVSDVNTQTKAVIDTAQKAQTVLTKVGALTGKEASTQAAGIVSAAATVGLAPTVDAVKQVAGVATNTLNNIPGTINTAATNIAKGITTGITNEVNAVKTQVTDTVNNAKAAVGQATDALKAIGSGAAAAGLANKLGGLGGISNAAKGLTKGLNDLKGNIKGIAGKLGGLFGKGGDGPSFTDLVESVKGPAGAAFTSIRDSLKPLQVGVPQNLTAIAKASATTIATISSTANKVEGLLKDAIDNTNSSITDIKSLIDNNTVAGIEGSFKQVRQQLGTLGDNISAEAAGIFNPIGSTSGVTSRITSQFGGNAVSTVTELNKSLIDTPKLISGLPTDTGPLVNPMNIINNTFNDITNDVAGETKTITEVPTAVENTMKEINTALKDVSGMAGAAPAIQTGDKKVLSSAAAAVQSGASAAMSSAMASGVNNLPGGMKSIGAVMNNIEGALNKLPGTEVLGDVVKDLQSTAVNAVNKVEGTINQVQGTINRVEGIANTINSKLGGALSKEGGLTNLITSALPLGAAAGLLSGLSALGSGGPAKIKLPTVSFNTFDRATIDNQVKTLLNNIKIPLPNLLGEIKSEVVNQIDQLIKKNKDSFKIFDQLDNWDQRIKDARDKLYEAERNLPAGDKGLVAAKNLVDSLMNDPEYVSLKKKAADFGNEVQDNVNNIINQATQTVNNILDTNKLGQAISNVKSSAIKVAQSTAGVKTAVGTVPGKSAAAIQELQSKPLVSNTEVNNSIAGIIGGITPPNINTTSTTPARRVPGPTNTATGIGPGT